jgi:hypothetical protein
MERRLHPSHDRTMCRTMICCFGGTMLSAGICALAAHLGWRAMEFLAFGVFLAPVAWLSLSRINTCRCPRCGRELHRPRDTQEFACETCEIVWSTRCYGFSLRG